MIEGGGASDCAQAQAANVGGFLEEFPQVDADDLPIGGWVIGDLFGKGAFFGLVFTGVVAWRKAVCVAIEPEHETAGGWRQCSPGELGVTVLAGLWVLGNLEVPGGHNVAKRRHVQGRGVAVCFLFDAAAAVVGSLELERQPLVGADEHVLQLVALIEQHGQRTTRGHVGMGRPGLFAVQHDLCEA